MLHGLSSSCCAGAIITVHRLRCSGLPSVEHWLWDVWASVPVVGGLGSCGSWASEHRMRKLWCAGLGAQQRVESSRPEIRPAPPASAGGPLTTEPSGKPYNSYLRIFWRSSADTEMLGGAEPGGMSPHRQSEFFPLCLFSLHYWSSKVTLTKATRMQYLWGAKEKRGGKSSVVPCHHELKPTSVVWSHWFSPASLTVLLCPFILFTCHVAHGICSSPTRD